MYLTRLNEDTGDDDKNDTLYFDRSFSRISNFIINGKEATNRFERLNGNKYNISAVNMMFLMVIHF